MGIATSLQHYLSSQGISYDCLEHAPTNSSIQSARASHIPDSRIAKGVVLKGSDAYIMAILPASSHVELEKVGGWLRQHVDLATEDEIVPLFPDCEPGAVPPVAAAYGLHALVDESLEDQSDIYFEAGDHRTLVHVSGEGFHKLMRKAPHGRIADGANGSVFDSVYYGA